jgi:DEAD/DEAH box helicase domain-containing protein
MDAAAFLHWLISLPDYRQQIVHVERIPARQAVIGQPNEPLHPELQSCLESLGIAALYSHQVEALDHILAGQNVVIATPSASGKTLCYHLATLDALLNDRESRALYIFPTKALAQDQLRSIRQTAACLSSQTPAGRTESISTQAIATFDGDTPRDQRTDVRRQAKIVLTNPDMLHLGILPNHQSWSKLLSNLKYVVVDETHLYRGVFGSHVANVLRRLRRLCRLYGSRPQFICCSATIANPREHAQNLVGMTFKAVTEDGSPHGEKQFAFWNPPFLSEARSGRRSPNIEAAFLLSELVSKGIRALVFARTRKLTELIYVYTRGRLSPSLAKRISPYRAGYLPQDRRRIEQQFFDGRLLGLVATTALEVGINIGDLEATVLTGYPGSIASAWQQAGRSGRTDDTSLSFLIAQDNPLDQYLMRNPDFLFSKNFDNAVINPGNPHILTPHLLCAAWEQPLTARDLEFFLPEADAALAGLEGAGSLRKRHGRWHPSPSVYYPAQDTSIRATSGQHYAVIDRRQGQMLETVEASVAFFQVHPGAIYLHQGESYLITELDLAQRIAWAEPSSADYYTQAMDTTDIRVQKLLSETMHRGVRVCLGDVNVTTAVIGFRRKRQLTEEVIAEEFLDLPQQSFPTRALWFDLPQRGLDRIPAAGLDLHGGLHACEHAAIGMLPLFALCDRNDIGGVSTAFHPDTGRAGVFIYDAYPGGIGIAEKGFEMIEELWKATLKTVQSCPCSDGCPSCVQSPKCGNNNQPLDKEAAIVLLEEILA